MIRIIVVDAAFPARQELASLLLNIKDVEVVAVNDPMLDADYMAYLLEYDSVHGRFGKPCSARALAREAVTSDLPTPPLPLITPIT